MTAYLQRLARPSRSPVIAAPAPGGWGLAEQRPSGVQEIDHVVQAPAPVSRPAATDRPHGGTAPSQAKEQTQPQDARVAVNEYVTRWLAGPAAVPAPARAAADPGSDAESAGPDTASLASPSRLVREVVKSAASEPRVTGSLPSSMPGTLEPFTAWESPSPEATSAVQPLAHATSPRPLATGAPASSHPSRTTSPERAAPASPHARRDQAARQVEVHIGSIALTVKVPAAPPTATAAPAPMNAPSTSTVRARTVSADPLRFSPARHHLRWS